MNYYNEIDPYPAQWLANLAAAGHLPPGRIDTRSIADVRPDDLVGVAQAHFFAGIGGWPLALRLAGWPADRPVWTGSCPCQPFSVAGKGRGEEDERHLWPEFRRLITECRPSVVFGEQVASAAGRAWLSVVRADLEDLGYAVGAADLCGASVGAPHIRQRLFWVAYAYGGDRRDGALQRRGEHGFEPHDGGSLRGSLCWSRPLWVAYAHQAGQRLERSGELLDGERAAQWNDADGCGEVGGMGDPSGPGLALGSFAEERRGDLRLQRTTAAEAGIEGDPWRPVEYLDCADGRQRPTQPGLFPLAHGVSGRVGKLRAYGNAIIPQVAAVFIRAVMSEIGP